jgi:hypothetical protein
MEDSQLTPLVRCAIHTRKSTEEGWTSSIDAAGVGNLDHRGIEEAPRAASSWYAYRAAGACYVSVTHPCNA